MGDKTHLCILAGSQAVHINPNRCVMVGWLPLWAKTICWWQNIQNKARFSLARYSSSWPPLAKYFSGNPILPDTPGSVLPDTPAQSLAPSCQIIQWKSTSHIARYIRVCVARYSSSKHRKEGEKIRRKKGKQVWHHSSHQDKDSFWGWEQLLNYICKLNTFI